MSTARETILQAVATGRGTPKAVPDYVIPAWSGAADAHFIAKARASNAEIHEIATREDAPETILSILIAAGLVPRLHLPPASTLNALAWHRAPGLAIVSAPPSGNDNAVSLADYGIAETGTLVFLSGPRSPSSWHFRPGREFVIFARDCILPRVEDIITRLKGQMPATLNLVTGPSRTADIEQTIELGAHGPRAVHILITG